MELPGGGRGEHRVVGHGIGEREGELGADLVVIERHLLGPGGRRGKLGAVEEMRRLQHRLNHQVRAGAERVDAGVKRRLLIEKGEMTRHLVVGQGPPECALPKRCDEGARASRSVRRSAGGNESRQGRGIAGHLGSKLVGGIGQFLAQRFADIQGVGLIVEAHERIARYAFVDVGDVRQLQQIADGVRPLLATEPGKSGRRHQDRSRRRRRHRVGVVALATAARTTTPLAAARVAAASLATTHARTA